MKTSITQRIPIRNDSMSKTNLIPWVGSRSTLDSVGIYIMYDIVNLGWVLRGDTLPKSPGDVESLLHYPSPGDVESPTSYQSPRDVEFSGSHESPGFYL